MIRLLLNEKNLDYAELRYSRPPLAEGTLDWELAKPQGIASGLLPFGQVPALTHINRPGLQHKGLGSVSMVQSRASASNNGVCRHVVVCRLPSAATLSSVVRHRPLLANSHELPQGCR